MEGFIKITNSSPIKISDIPVISFEILREKIISDYDKKALRCIGFFGAVEDSRVRLFVFLSDDKHHFIYLSSSYMEKDSSFKSISADIPAFHVYEREFYEEFGILPQGHPWLKSIRYSHDRAAFKHPMKEHSFFKMEGESLHEVAVGPIHAGVIEPGHFRFICNGEEVLHLEIQLGYQHRNVEKLFVENGKKFTPHLAESIAGDTVIANNWAYLNIVESLSETLIPMRASIIRTMALEIERAALHLADLSALANDVAYLMGSSVLGATRTIVINSFLAICGNRFGRGLMRPGGCVFDVKGEILKRVRGNILKAKIDSARMCEAMFQSHSVASRFENTCAVSKTRMREIGAVGMAARASSLDIDARISHPIGVFDRIEITPKSKKTGDVYSRAYLRYEELMESLDIVLNLLGELEKDSSEEIISEIGNTFAPSSLILSIVEGWRGEVIHCAITDDQGTLSRYKIKDPSFNNWFALALALRNNAISDFPLCNKSFNLSYCGNDLQDLK